MLRAAGGDRQSLVCLGLRNGWRVVVRVGTKTYPAMVESVRFHEQNLGGYYTREEEDWAFAMGS